MCSVCSVCPLCVPLPRSLFTGLAERSVSRTCSFATVSPHRLSSRRRRTLEAGRWTSDTTATTCRSTPSLEPSWMPVSSHIVSFHRARPPGHLGRDCPRRRSRSLQMWLRWFCPRRSASRRRRLRLCCRHEMLCLPSAEASRRRQPVQQQLLRTQISGRTCGR